VKCYGTRSLEFGTISGEPKEKDKQKQETTGLRLLQPETKITPCRAKGALKRDDELSPGNGSFSLTRDK
jgi:hypothetical protein